MDRILGAVVFVVIDVLTGRCEVLIPDVVLGISLRDRPP
jgi:hypothetical protein